MSLNIQHTLLNHEITPPADTWTAIAARLDVEYDATDTSISQKMYDWETVPPVHAWENIQAGLYGTVPVKKRARVIPFRKVAVAAAMIIAAGLISWYFLINADGNPDAATRVATIEPTIPAPLVKENNTAPSPAAALINIIRQRPLPKRPPRMVIANPGFEPGQTDYADNVIASDIPNASVNNISISTTKSPAVTGPLLRDKNGTIILDRNLITASDNNYIIVTGPNGEQTRISSRFFQMLSSMNGDPDPTEYFDIMIRGNTLWKSRFREWRNQLMKQASFIPSGTNFLDILELKDIIKE